MSKKMLCAIVLASASLAPALFAADRQTADILLVSVPKLIETSDFKTAEDMCKRALASDETSPAAHYFLGICLEKTSRPHDAFKEYQQAQTLAEKEKDGVTGKKAADAAKKLGGGLIEIDQADQKLLAKLVAVGTEALEAEQLETAKSAFAAAVALAPNHEKAKDGLEKASKAIEARGDPVKAKIAQAALAEIWYKIGSGDRDEALKKAKELAEKSADTDAGKEAADLVARNFEPPKAEEVKELQQKLVEQTAKEKKLAAAAPPTPPTPAPATGTGGSGTAAAPVKVAAPRVDVAAIEKTAEADAKKLAKEALVAAFTEAYVKGKAFYSKATPGSEGNQQNLDSAHEQFIRCEQFYMRIEEANLITDKVAQMEKSASMLRFACLKMTVLAH